MKNAVLKNHLRSLVRLMALLVTASVLTAQALTLGEVQGDVWIGAPLDLRIALRTDQDEEIAASCVSADIYYGEALQTAPRITVSAKTLRLQLPDVVTEPVVAIQVRTTCGANQVRRYVLLPDIAPSISAPVVTLNTLSAAEAQATVSNAWDAPDAAAVPQRAAAGSSVGKAAATQPKAKVKAKVKTKSKAPSKTTTKPQKKKAPKPKVARATQKAIPQPAKSMLKLDPLEILSDRMDTLDGTMLFAPAEDALLQTRQIASLQADLKAMQDLAAKNDRSLLELRGQLEQAKGQQLPMALVYGLIALLLVCLTALAWLWQRQKKFASLEQSWWRNPSDDELAAAIFQNSSAMPAYGDKPPPGAPRRAQSAPSPLQDFDFTSPKDPP